MIGESPIQGTESSMPSPPKYTAKVSLTYTHDKNSWFSEAATTLQELRQMVNQSLV